MGKALAVRNKYRLQQWAKIAEECAGSGMTNKAYCAEHGIAEKSYYYWLRRLREAAVDAIPPQLVELKLNGRLEQSRTLCMRYQGAELMVTDGTPAEVLHKALQVLKKL